MNWRLRMTWHIVRKLFLLEFCARCTMQLDPAYWNSLHALYGGHKVMLSNPPDALVTCHVGPRNSLLCRKIGSVGAA